VRELGAVLDLPAEIIWRQPFPGPGLATRVLGEVTEERLTLLREADAIVQDEVQPPERCSRTRPGLERSGALRAYPTVPVALRATSSRVTLAVALMRTTSCPFNSK
jgi:GMP synthase PP-ATPase subunit